MRYNIVPLTTFSLETLVTCANFYATRKIQYCFSINLVHVALRSFQTKSLAIVIIVTLCTEYLTLSRLTQSVNQPLIFAQPWARFLSLSVPRFLEYYVWYSDE